MSNRWIIFLVTIVGLLMCWCLFGQSRGYYEQPIINGDVNADGRICMDDSMQVIYHLWRDGRELPCPDAADVDRNGVVNLNDVIGGLRHIFFGDYINDCPVSCDGASQTD